MKKKNGQTIWGRLYIMPKFPCLVNLPWLSIPKANQLSCVKTTVCAIYKITRYNLEPRWQNLFKIKTTELWVEGYVSFLFQNSQGPLIHVALVFWKGKTFVTPDRPKPCLYDKIFFSAWTITPTALHFKTLHSKNTVLPFYFSYGEKVLKGLVC